VLEDAIALSVDSMRLAVEDFDGKAGNGRADGVVSGQYTGGVNSGVS
jgi:hypothetical protein